jgi:hypothetical protein
VPAAALTAAVLLRLLLPSWSQQLPLLLLTQLIPAALLQQVMWLLARCCVFRHLPCGAQQQPG